MLGIIYPFPPPPGISVPATTSSETTLMLNKRKVQNKSTRFSKTRVNMIEPGQQMDGWPLRARLCTCPDFSPESHSVQVPQPSLEWVFNYINRGPHAERSQTQAQEPVVHVRARWITDWIITQHSLNILESSECSSWTLCGRRQRNMRTNRSYQWVTSLD